MTPTLFHAGGFRFFFYSREEARRHVHVSHPDGEAKFWLEPSIVLASYQGLTGVQVRTAERLVRLHRKEIEDGWVKHFGDQSP